MFFKKIASGYGGLKAKMSYTQALMVFWHPEGLNIYISITFRMPRHGQVTNTQNARVPGCQEMYMASCQGNRVENEGWIMGMITVNQKHASYPSMLEAKRFRPLDIKSVALHGISSRNIMFQNGSVDIIDVVINLNSLDTFPNRLITKGLQK